MRNVLASLLLAWLATIINVGMSTSTQGPRSPPLSSSTRGLETVGSKVRSIDDYDQEDEMVIPRLRHRLRQDISSRLEARGILFDKMGRSQRRRYRRRPPFFIGSPFRYEARYAGGLGPYYSPYGNYEMNPYEELPDEMEGFFSPPLFPLYYQSPEFNNRPSSPHYRPQSYSPSGQPSYYSDQFQQMEPTQARPYYRGEAPVSNRRRPLNMEPSYQPERVSPYYPSQTPQPNRPLPPPYYYNPSTPVSMGQENSRQPIRRPPTKLDYRDESNVQPLRPSTDEGRPVQFPGPRVSGPRLPQPAVPEQLQARPSYPNEFTQGRPLRASTLGADSEQRAPTVTQQTRPNYRDESDMQLPGLNRHGRPELTSQQPAQSAFQRPSRNEFNDQSPVLNAQKQSVPTPTPENHKQTTDPRLERRGAMPDYHNGLRGQDSHLQPSPTSGVRPELDQDARSKVLQKIWAPSDLHDEIQPQPVALGQSSSPQSNLTQPKIDEPKNGQVPLTAEPSSQKSLETPQSVEPTRKTD